jgi:hypothetical protein
LRKYKVLYATLPPFLDLLPRFSKTFPFLNRVMSAPVLGLENAGKFS